MQAVRENIPRITEFVDAALEQLGCNVKAQMAIDIALDEILANICHYAYTPGTGAVEVCIEYDADNRMAVVTFRDKGVPFDPLQKEDPDTTLTAQERQIGGLGIFLVRKTMDAVEYRHEDGFNVLTIRKKIG